MTKNIYYYVLLLLPLCACNTQDAPEVIKSNLRAPAYPLVTIDPYTSAWSYTDNLYDGSVKHWTDKDFPLLGAIRVDGQTYRFMGIEKTPLKAIQGNAYHTPWKGAYTVNQPAKGWETRTFNDAAWKTGASSFGMGFDPSVQTAWETEHIWVRRVMDLQEDLSGKKLYLEYSHDDDFELYINGIEVVNTGRSANKNVMIPLPEEVAKTLKKGKNIFAAHCYNAAGEALVDFGLYEEGEIKPSFATTAQQKSVDVQATQTHYVFDCGNVELSISFIAPLLMDDLNLVSRPVNYIAYEVKSLDGNEHDVELYIEASPVWALNVAAAQKSRSEAYEKDGLIFMKAGNIEQNILGRQGDDTRIDWGYFYLAADKTNTTYAVGDQYEMRQAFTQSGAINTDASAKNDANMAIVYSLGKTKSESGKLMIGYDDIYSIQYFGENLRPYWNKNGEKSIESAFAEAAKEYEKLRKQCYAFDLELMKTATAKGGQKYAELCALAYRQAISAHKLVEAPNGDLLFLSKENFSNGSIGTVDITYPSAPLFLYYNPELAKGLLNHIFYYSESGKWTKPFPSHDIGTYPWANGQTYGDDMPVEEAGNMLTIAAAITALDGNAAYAEKHWDVMTIWADYLWNNGLDPDNQLCTDDFAGHFAHNANLSVKAIMGVASYGYMADKMGKKDVADKYMGKAKEMAQEWMKMADDGDHYRLTFDQTGTWSQKYNLIWDKLMGWNIFPSSVLEKEIAYYKTKENEYGLPLDNRRTYTKADWIIWTATLADDQATFEQFVAPVYKFMNETEDRIPMSDWYYTDSKKHVGFQARSVVGGYYIKMLEDKLP